MPALKRNFSVSLKITAIVALVMVLWIPLLLVQDLVRERRSESREAKNKIASYWGSSKTINEPYLVVESYEQKGEVILTSTHKIAVSHLDIDATLTTQERSYSIYKTPVYEADVTLNAAFDFKKIRLIAAQKNTSLKNARLVFVTSGGFNQAQGQWNGKTLDVPCEDSLEGAKEPENCEGFSVPIEAFQSENQNTSFQIALKLQGTERFRVGSSAQNTRVKVSSNWPHPSFSGALPKNRTISSAGFEANWEMSRDQSTESNTGFFEIEFVHGVDIYQQVTRSVKYGFLFVGLTFTVFFLFEVLKKISVHPIQYLFIGLALSIFYLLLLSLSEHIDFQKAYATAAASTVLLISLYSASVLKQNRKAFFVGGLLSALYSYLYVLLRLEDYALLVGSTGLFIILAVIMLITRKINWYDIRQSSKPETLANTALENNGAV